METWPIEVQEEKGCGVRFGSNPDIDSYITGDKEIRYDESGHVLADLYLSAVLFGVSQVLLRKELIVTMQKVRVESGSRQSQSAVNLLTSGLSKLNPSHTT